MQVEETYLKECYVLTPNIFEDKRGSFFESFNAKTFEQLTNLKVNFIQDNQSFSKKGVLRGLHYQEGDNSQAKLVRVIKGSVLDVCLDLRETSKTFGKYFSIILNDTENKQVFIPRGFAHGFVVLSDIALFSYKCDNFYNKTSEKGIIYNDPNLNIDWKIPEGELIISDKDLQLTTFENTFK